LFDFQEVSKAKSERWKLALNRFYDVVTGGEEVIEKMRDNISSVVEFWEAVKANPMNQFNTLQQ
jgi:polyhydroxyalkanoate synthesis regulator phasin